MFGDYTPDDTVEEQAKRDVNMIIDSFKQNGKPFNLEEAKQLVTELAEKRTAENMNRLSKNIRGIW
jgi:hypothetical protein